MIGDRWQTRTIAIICPGKKVLQIAEALSQMAEQTT